MEAKRHELDDLRRAEDVSRQLMRLGLRGADVPALLGCLAEVLCAPCALVTVGGRLLASAGLPRTPLPPDDLVAALTASRAFAEARTADPMGALGQSPLEEALSVGGREVHQLVAPIVEGNRVASVLAVWIPGARPSDWERLATQHTATVIAFSGLRDRSHAEALPDVLHDLVAALMNRDLDGASAMRERLQRSGFDLKLAHVPVVLAPRESRPLDARSVHLVRERMREAGARGGAVTWEGHVVALIEAPADLPARHGEHRWRSVAGELAAALRRDVVAGVGPASRGVLELAEGLWRAGQAARIGSRLVAGRRVYDADTTWFYAALLRAHENGHLDGTWRPLLKDLMEEDERTGGMLLTTLDAFFDCQQSYTETARYLYVHPNTVRYRLHKIKRVIGTRPFEDPLLRTAYHMALKAELLFGQGFAGAADPEAHSTPYVSLATSANT